MSYEQKMMAMKKMLKKAAPPSPKQARKPSAPPYVKQWQQAGLDVIENDFGVCFVRECFYPNDYEHGDATLGDFHRAVQQTASLAHPLVPTQPVMFFDTETTGLKGVGTQIFLLGELAVEPGGFRLKQYVQADPANEAAMLYASSMWQGQEAVVSYNGKSFDWPQLTTRFTMHREQLPLLPERTQIDLLHATRRIWKEDVTSMKLTAIEQQKLGFYRQGDIPGFLAPIIYADAVKSGNPETLLKVLMHNEWDLLSLVTLYAKALDLLALQLKESARTYTNIGKWYGDVKARETSRAVLTRVTEHYDVTETHAAHYALGFHHKRIGAYERARDDFLKALPQLKEVERLRAHEQLAMLYEHQLGDVAAALAHCEAGLRIIEASTRLQQATKARRLAQWHKRKWRLLSKHPQKDADT